MKKVLILILSTLLLANCVMFAGCKPKGELYSLTDEKLQEYLSNTDMEIIAILHNKQSTKTSDKVKKSVHREIKHAYYSKLIEQYGVLIDVEDVIIYYYGTFGHEDNIIIVKTTWEGRGNVGTYDTEIRGVKFYNYDHLGIMAWRIY